MAIQRVFIIESVTGKSKFMQYQEIEQRTITQNLQNCHSLITVIYSVTTV